jgi:hypothetical protein
VEVSEQEGYSPGGVRDRSGRKSFGKNGSGEHFAEEKKGKSKW